MREVIEGYLCLKDHCNKELKDGIPPCENCEDLISIQDYEELEKGV